MARLLPRLLQSLPGYFDTSPIGDMGLTIEYDGASAEARIEHRQLTIRVSGGTGSSLSLDLSQLTLSGLSIAISATPGYTATLLTQTGTLPATRLIETDGQDIFIDRHFQVFTSRLWSILQPIAWTLEDTVQNIENAAAQGTLLTAEGLWVDLWGEDYYGDVRRRTAELDRAYAERIIREVLRRRINGLSLEQILLEDVGAQATIIDLHEQAWIIGETRYGILAGRKHSRTTFEVLVQEIQDFVVTDIVALIERNRAAGTLPFYRFRNTGGQVDEEQEAIVSTQNITAKFEIGPNLVWTSGVDPLGALPTALPDNLAQFRHYEISLPSEQVLLILFGTPALFDVWRIGVDPLGKFPTSLPFVGYVPPGDTGGDIIGGPSLVLGLGRLGVNGLGEVGGAIGIVDDTFGDIGASFQLGLSRLGLGQLGTPVVPGPVWIVGVDPLGAFPTSLPGS